MRISTVDITRDEIAEYDRKLKIIAIPRNQIDSVELKYGVPSERIILTIFIGIVLIAIGIILGFLPVFHMYLKSDWPKSAYCMKMFAMAMPLVVIGFYIIFNIFNRKYYLQIRFKNNERKIIFKENIYRPELYDYIKRVNKNFGYNIEFKID